MAHQATAKLAIHELLNQLSDPHAPVRADAVYALSNCADQRAIDPLRPLLRDPIPHVRASAVYALYHLEARHIGEDLLPLLSDPDVKVRLEAILAISQCPEPRALEPRLTLLEDEDDTANNLWKRISMNNQADFPYGPNATQKAAHDNLAAVMAEVRRHIADPLLEEVQQQLAVANAPPGDDIWAREFARARAQITALICLHTAIDAWINRTLEDEFPDAWKDLDGKPFPYRVRNLGTLMQNPPASPPRAPYSGTLDSGGTVSNALLELNVMRNNFVHYKARLTVSASPDDPYEKLKQLPDIIQRLYGLRIFGLAIPDP